MDSRQRLAGPLRGAPSPDAINDAKMGRTKRGLVRA